MKWLWLLLLVGVGRAQVTWRGQVASIVYAHCVGCHHAGGSGPFALTTYAEARRFADVMGPAVSTRYMPPWLPAAGHGDFQDSRRLSDVDVSLIAAWVKAGAPEGIGAVPVGPRFTSEWALGKPDLVLETAGAVSVSAGGADKFVNVILPNPLKGTRWVRAMEIKPRTPQVVHHANVILDRTGSLRRTHADWREGVPGMGIDVDSGDVFDPDTHFLFWKPDSTALVEPVGMPWRLDEGNDLVLNLHLKPTGKAESVRARIGLYFTDQPAVEHPMLVQLEHDSALDIPAGEANFVVEDSLTLPVEVKVLGVYPHAHYLGKRLEAWADLPGGGRRDLILIPDWDIDRQSVYRLREPLDLPAGTVVRMRYVFDNSAGNVHNPHTPAVRVTAGNNSEDEMAHLWLQVLPVPVAGMTEEQAREKLDGAWMESLLGKNPGDRIALYNLASLDLSAGEAAKAEGLYGRLVGMAPGDARARTGLGAALEAGGKDGAGEFRAALRIDPANVDAAFDLAEVDVREGNAAEAEGLLAGIVRGHGGDLTARRLLAGVYRADGKSVEAMGEMREVVRLGGTSADWNDLGVMEARAGDRVGARRSFGKALELEPGLEAARANLGRLGPG